MVIVVEASLMQTGSVFFCWVFVCLFSSIPSSYFLNEEVYITGGWQLLQFDLFLKSILCGFQAEGLHLMLASIMFSYFLKFVGHWCTNKVNVSGITLQSLCYGT